MKISLSLIIFSISCINASPSTFIVNGKEAKVGQFPYQVLIYFFQSPKKGVCGGVLINDRYVLTAAHCLFEFDYVQVHLGAHDRTNFNEEGRIIFNLKDFKSHENYNPELVYNDIGLIKLPEVVKFTDKIKPIMLPDNEQDEFEGQKAIVSGWGLEHTHDIYIAKKLRYAELKIITNEECQREFNETEEPIIETIVCAKGENKESGCSGDSGGPLVIKETGILVGITSFIGDVGCETGMATAFTRVNKYLDWIKNNMD